MNKKNFQSRTLLITESNLSTTNTSSPTLTPELDHLELSTANINKLVCNNIHLANTIYSPEASIANLDIYYNSKTDTTHLKNLSKNLIVHVDNNETIKILENGDIIVNNNLIVKGNSKMDNCIMNNLDVDNINLLADLIATDIAVTNNLKVANHLESTSAHIHGNIKINENIECKQILADKIKAPLIKTIAIKTPIIKSKDDLQLLAGPVNTINIPNIRFGLDVNNTPTITPPMIKNSKIFVVNKHILLQGDPSCDAMEIIIYNQSPLMIIIRDVTNVVKQLESNCAVKLVYLSLINRWVII